MKPYKQVVEERYNRLETQQDYINDQYSMMNPVGFYISMSQRRLFYRVFNELKSRGVSMSEAQILDLGCGKGDTLRMFLEFTGKVDNLSGLDLSESRIIKAKELNSSIDYKIADIVDYKIDGKLYDLVTALDVFMHLPSKDEVLRALQSIHGLLAEQGYFLWYDAYAQDHFISGVEDDHKGFHPHQMDDLAEQSGFVRVANYNLFRVILKKYNTPYLARKFPFWLVRCIERCYPGTPGNVIRLYQKRKM